MKRHLSRFIFFLFAFATGLILSPIHFKGTAIGHGIVKDGGDFYWIRGFKSMYFIGLSHEGEQYESTNKAKKILVKRLVKVESEDVKSQEVLEQNDTRAIIHFERKDKSQGYCIFRVEDSGLRNICSTSLWHILEFEKQNY